MSNRSKIEWTDATWNPVSGCSKVSPGCAHCYAERLTERFHGKGSFDKIVLHPERLEEPLRWKKPSRVFVNSMSDLFHEEIPVRFIAEVFNIMASWVLRCRAKHDHEESCWIDPGHTFQVLTKRPKRMLEVLKPDGELEADVAEHWPGDSALSLEMEQKGWPLKNVWLGVSVENQEFADRRIPLLLQTHAAVRFVSYEPALGPVDFTAIRQQLGPGSFEEFSCLEEIDELNRGTRLPRLDWVICGGESGPGARPMQEAWARSLRDQCVAAGVPFFFKQWGGIRDKRGGEKALLDGRLWHEFPSGRVV